MEDCTRRAMLAASAGVVAGPVFAETQSDRDVMMRFVSLGVNCEFGQAQHSAGADPLDLFRWAGIFYPNLVKLIEDRFARIGDPEYISIRGTGRNAMIDHKFYGFSWHSFASDGDTPETIKDREVKRLPFLGRKMVEDITAAERTFVIKPQPRNPLTEAQIDRLVTALTAYGGRPTVMLVNEGVPAPAVSRRNGQVLDGHIPRFADGGNVVGDTRSPDWWALCRLALHA